MSKSLKVTLYYANWCGHCQSIKKEWDQITEGAKSIANKHKGVKIITESIEDEKIQKDKSGKINDKEIEGYPTIKFTLTSGKESKEYEYLKQRDPDVILGYMDKVADGLSSYKAQ